MSKMTVYLGWFRTTKVEVDVTDRGAGAGEITCPECGGSGLWTFHPELDDYVEQCTPCKGTGLVLISI